MNQPPNEYQPLPMPENATVQERLAHVAALRAQKDRRAAALTRVVIDPDSPIEAIKRTEARRAEQALRDQEMHRVPVQTGPMRNEAPLPPAQHGQDEDKESANLLGEEMGGQATLSVSSAGEPDAVPTQTGPGQHQESMANINEIQARLGAHIIRAATDRILSTQTGRRQNAELMESVDAIQARLRAHVTRAVEDRMRSMRVGHRQETAAEAPAARTAESAAQPTPAAPPAGDAHPAPTPDAPKRFTGGLQNEALKVARTTLTDEVKQFIVKGLACYDTPAQVAEAATLMFGVSISRQRVYRYSPDNPRPPARRWRELHAATRQALLRELAEIGVAHRAVRLRRLDRLESRSERSNVTTALKCLEMAAKECGGMYEKRRPIALQAPVPQAATG